VTQPKPVPGGEREMMEFETITLAPINLDLVVVELLTAQERDWLNAYHARVRKTLAPLIPADIKDWFENATRAI
jgi:Xaa-Pro aminopeptidase